MSAPKHTPGPWLSKVKEKAGFIYCWVQNRDNYIADMSPAYVKNHGVDAEVMKANAALIAAAPDLFAVLAAIVAEIDRRGLCLNDAPRLCAIDEGLIVQAMAALEKATGGAA